MIVPKITETKHKSRDESFLRARQRFALYHPCSVYTECGREGYRSIFKTESGINFITVLTVDLWDKPISFHSQIGIIGAGGKAKPSHLFTYAERLEAVEYAQYLLGGVGVGALRFERDGLAVGFAKTLTIQETAIALAMQGNVPVQQSFPIGELDIYDEADLSTKIGDNLFIPKTRTVIYGRGN